jgi:serine/threonine protein kinase
MIAPNTLLQNRYLVLKQIGQGGMGAVYIATDERFGSTVALKETFFTDPGLRKAFEREARLLNHLRHPALPRVSDHFVEEEGQFLVMEYIAGDDLAEKLRERGGAFPSSEVLNWADQLLDALDYLHTQEPTVIHRDIKPQNLKLTPRNAIVLLDFGLAKGTAATQTKVTATASVFGYSRNYAPLEQIQGAGTDPRSDLYSLAATLYHLITGVTPPDALARATAVLNGQPDPLLPANKVHAQVIPAVAEVLSQAMAQNAGQRPQTAATMREAMREAARQGHSLTRDITSAQAASSSNVYEQDTQLLFAAAPSTATGEAAEETGALKRDGAATARNPMPAENASASTKSPESVVTKVAEQQPTVSQKQPRKRIFAIVASASVLLALAAGVYTLTRSNNTAPTATPAESVRPDVQAEPTAPQPSNTNDEHPMKVVIIEKGKDTATLPDGAPPPVTRPISPARTAKTNPQPNPDPGNDAEDAGDNDTPEPPDPAGPPIRRGTRRALPEGVPVEEAIQAAEERRREAEEQRRAAREQRRIMMLEQMRLMRQRNQRRRTP